MRPDTRMKELFMENATLEIEIDVVLDTAPPKTFVDIHDLLGEERPEDLLEFLEHSVHQTTPPHQLRAIA